VSYLKVTMTAKGRLVLLPTSPGGHLRSPGLEECVGDASVRATCAPARPAPPKPRPQPRPQGSFKRRDLAASPAAPAEGWGLYSISCRNRRAPSLSHDERQGRRSEPQTEGDTGQGESLVLGPRPLRWEGAG
jgi:hypothetical protein